MKNQKTKTILKVTKKNNNRKRDAVIFSAFRVCVDKNIDSIHKKH